MQLRAALPGLLRCFAGLFSAVVSVANVAYGADFTCGAQPIRLAFYEHGYFYYVNDAQHGQGIDQDVVDELAKRSGCKFSTQLMMRARIWADLASGEVDMSVSGIQTPERDRFAWFAHYLRMKNYAVVRRNVANQARDSQAFIANPAFTFGVVRAFKHGDELDRLLLPLRQAGRVQESADGESIFKKIKENRVDAMYAQPPVYRKRIQDMGMHGEVVIQDWAPREKGVRHGLILAKSRFSEREAAQWRKLIDGMRQDGSLRRIFERYLPPAEAAVLLEP